MAKASIKARQKHRVKIVEKYKAQRAQIKNEAREQINQGEIPWKAYEALQKLPRDASPRRLERRCRLCGRTHAVYRRFGICRLCLRILAMRGYIPGLRKASW